MTNNNSAVRSFSLNLSVVRKLVLGFSLLALLLIITSVLSYIGLRSIAGSAEEVAYTKMPIQKSVFSLNEALLNLAMISTKAGYEKDVVRLEKLEARFKTLSEQYNSSVKGLNSLITGSDLSEFEQTQTRSREYLEYAQTLLETRFALIKTSSNLRAAAETALSHTDESSALMMDLSYLDNQSADMENLIGMSTNIDNKLSSLLTSIKELLNENDPDIATQVVEDIDYALSNIEVDIEYALRIAATVNDDGILDMFKQEYAKATQALKQDDMGVFALKKRQIALLSQSASLSSDSENAIEMALSSLGALSNKVNSSALDGQQNILTAVQDNVIKSIVISVLGILATVVLAITSTRSIAKPLSKVNKRLRVISCGDLTKTLDESGNDEFAELSKNINLLVRSLHSLISSIYEKEEQLHEVTLRTKQIGDHSLNQVAEQRSQIDLTSENTQKVKQTSLSNLNQIQSADLKLVEAMTQSDTVVNLANRSLTQVNKQATQAQHSVEIVNRLGDNSNKIGSILDVIKTIAEQTNLLALNAAIEAARAGEQGRGFAVVADEVRTLATRTHDSTEEIEKMIGNLQQDSQQAVEAMKHGAQQVKESVEITNNVTEQVNAIKAIIESLAAVNKTIVDDTKTQDALLDDVVNRLHTIVNLSNDSASSTQASNDAIHEISSQMEALRDAVGKFKLA